LQAAKPILGRTDISSLFLRVFFVEKIVESFPEFPEEFQDSPLAKRHSFLVRGTTPYLSITMRRALSPFDSLLPAAPQIVLYRGYPHSGIKIM
jgi:hypothetical protein